MRGDEPGPLLGESSIPRHLLDLGQQSVGLAGQLLWLRGRLVGDQAAWKRVRRPPVAALAASRSSCSGGPVASTS
jgi:hypothetical protein